MTAAIVVITMIIMIIKIDNRIITLLTRLKCQKPVNLL